MAFQASPQTSRSKCAGRGWVQRRAKLPSPTTKINHGPSELRHIHPREASRVLRESRESLWFPGLCPPQPTAPGCHQGFVRAGPTANMAGFVAPGAELTCSRGGEVWSGGAAKLAGNEWRSPELAWLGALWTGRAWTVGRLGLLSRPENAWPTVQSSGHPCPSVQGSFGVDGTCQVLESLGLLQPPAQRPSSDAARAKRWLLPRQAAGPSPARAPLSRPEQGGGLTTAGQAPLTGLPCGPHGHCGEGAEVGGACVPLPQHTGQVRDRCRLPRGVFVDGVGEGVWLAWGSSCLDTSFPEMLSPPPP